MTGLDPKIDTIIEMATLITDGNLNVIDEGPDLVIHQPAERYERMDRWNQEHHKSSGLWDRVLASHVTLQEAEALTLQFIRKYFKRNEAFLTGNSIWQDRRFIMEHMKDMDQFLHYRMIDISAIKSLCVYWYPDVKFKKKGNHRALDDIKESVAELRFYRETIFQKSASLH